MINGLPRSGVPEPRGLGALPFGDRSMRLRSRAEFFNTICRRGVRSGEHPRRLYRPRSGRRPDTNMFGTPQQIQFALKLIF